MKTQGTAANNTTTTYYPSNNLGVLELGTSPFSMFYRKTEADHGCWHPYSRHHTLTHSLAHTRSLPLFLSFTRTHTYVCTHVQFELNLWWRVYRKDRQMISQNINKHARTYLPTLRPT